MDAANPGLSVNEAVAKPTTTSSTKKAAPTTAVVSSSLIAVTDKACGASGATKNVKAHSGPNGNIDWLNCGVNEGGWTPPYVTVNDIKAASLETALDSSSSPFHACKDYIGLFTKYANENGLPPILIASIAMQESTCNPNTVGGAGEQGLMQLTKDKCGAAPGGNCKDVNYNIKTGAKFFADSLKANGGDLLHTIGGYNGWPKKMTFSEATAAAHTDCCRCQNNLDYLHQTLNGWMQNVDPYTSKIGKYWNLDQC
ncbi:lysozyme-like protein [Punctularia strigosozonata HHB-11173 SS5]|uniref:lysozyme-like protein n=1 Tax=Punctularia strigosozonata (strain HHB-11173) TaxID=741275 RepID=UPI00044168AF|nr:lysozyme-like protein [Punctularia strigosozonata HHB-11173 SS5]EIN11855.1 lysozyme-like protein [Punctularia strigosozonata HHB-11173 SS5]